eukprot:5962196-Karenia_brevis.AAC.1
MAPNTSRFPLPWPWVAGIALSMMYNKHSAAALALLLCFNTYLRPGECLALRMKDVVAPAPNADMPFWA